jgi:putative PIG3 family NAD(P)H quinone oxidoreductase
MWAVTIEEEGSPATLGWAEFPDPVPGPGEVLIDVAASAVNRADLLQAAGLYPVPPGASPILGMECSGVIAAVGPGVYGWQVGDEVCALLAGGGYAQQVVVPAVQVLPVPAGVDLVDAAGLPEVTCTVWSNLVMTAGLSARQTVLIHGGSSGIGTMAIQVARMEGANVAVTASRPEALQACIDLGAQLAINYTNQDFVTELRAATDGRGADIILDVVGAKYLQRNIDALADGGRLIIIGMQGGTKAELDINTLLRKRGGIIATALRSRPESGPGSKGAIVAEVRERLWPRIAAGDVRPVIDTVMDMRDAGAAHRRLARGGHVGKIVLRAPARGSGPAGTGADTDVAISDPQVPDATEESSR